MTEKDLWYRPAGTLGPVSDRNDTDREMIRLFREALAAKEITFYLQPQVRASNGLIVGAEALARWKGRDGKLIPAGSFIPVLERHGVIPELDLTIWESVCRWLSGWKVKGNRTVPVSVNISQADITAVDVPKILSELTERYGLSVNDIKAEITESAYAEDPALVRSTVHRLQEAGFTVLMDDFGSGYSSLNMLRSVDVDLIKLDAQFLQIRDTEARKGFSILESVLNLTSSLATPVIVEGVEEENQVSYLRDLGCRYMQGFFFYRPMPAEAFEALIADPAVIDEHGFRFKPNEQIRMREFLDENVFTDTMLNNALGPVVFYNLHGEDIDIVRFNEQFYELVGLELEEFEGRKLHIQDYIYPSDRQVFYGLLRDAEKQWSAGAEGVVRTYRPNGALVWLSLRVFFMEEDSRGKRYYASAHDVTETQVINAELPGAYYRCAVNDTFDFLFIGRNFLRLTGYREREIRILFRNRLLNMVHPKDRPGLLMQSKQIQRGELASFRPFRILRKQGDYIYIAEQGQITDLFGAPCWQAIAVDVTEVMHLRNQMRVLSKHLNRTVLFLRSKPDGLRYEVVIHGLHDRLGMDAREFAASLNNGIFCRYIEGYRDIPHDVYTELFIRSIAGSQKKLHVTLPDGRELHLLAHADRVDDPASSIEYIVDLSPLDPADGNLAL